MKYTIITILFFVSIPASATSYFISPTGNDSNNGTSTGTPWLSPNHAVNCGDTIQGAASSSYSSANFVDGKWGTVTCAGGNNVAWLTCVTFDACKISSSGNHAMKITASYWGVQGWETTTTGTGNGCFSVQPPNSSTNLHHIIFANDVANTCSGGGFNIFFNGSAGVDYLVAVGNIAYNTATGSGECFSAFSINTPATHDTVSGTHVYFAGNFAWANVDPNPCAGTAPTDGEGLIFDTINGNSYKQQMVAYNNIFIGNGGRCFQPLNSTSGAPIYIEYNTCYGNETDLNQTPGGSLGELRILNATNVTALYNIAQTTAANGPQSHPLYAYYVITGNSTDNLDYSWLYSAAGNNCGVQAPAGGFVCGTHSLTGTSAAFSNPTIPGAPSCGSASSVPACMSTVISNFTPTTSGASAYGYKIPLSYSITDPLFPAWLCTVTLPAGLVTRGCGAPPTLGSSVGATVGVAGKTSVQ